MATGRAPVRKVTASGLGGAAATVALWLVSLTGVDVPAPVAGALTLIVMSTAGYQVKPEPGEQREE